VDLERHEIQRTDFSQARRGYDPEEVDVHLRDIAAAVDDLRHEVAQSSTSSTMAGAAADRVRAIVEAAEGSASDIEVGAQAEADQMISDARSEAEETLSAARAEANRLRGAAEADAKETRSGAASDASRLVEKVEDAIASMREKAVDIEADLKRLHGDLSETVGKLVVSIRAESERVETELGSLKAGLLESDAASRDEDVPAAATVVAEETGANDAFDDEDDQEPEAEDYHEDDEPAQPAAEAEDDELTAEDQPAEEKPAAAETGSGPATGGEDGAEGARLIALNMALNGTTREEAARYLEENFELSDPDAILEDVYARVGG
jgi:DivIVA domain-containing protein